MQLQQGCNPLLGGGADSCFLKQLQNASDGLFRAGEASPDNSDSMGATLHNNLGDVEASAARRASLEAALATQQAAQLQGMDMPMLEDLLPLEDLHDPFLDELQSTHLGARVQPHEQQHGEHDELEKGQQEQIQQQEQGQQQPQGQGQPGSTGPHFAPVPPAGAVLPLKADPSEPPLAASFSPTTAGFFGIPAYAEPDSPAAALLNNSAAGTLPPVPAVPVLTLPVSMGAHQQPVVLARCSTGVHPAGLPLGPALVFGAHHAFAAVQAQAQAAAAGMQHCLPPAIAAAQHRAAAAAAAAAAAHMQQQQQHAEKASCGDAGAGASHLSNGSRASDAAGMQPSGGVSVGPAGLQQRSDDSSGGEQQVALDAFDDVGCAASHLGHAGSAALPATAAAATAAALAGLAPATAACDSYFTMGDARDASMAGAAAQQAKRGGRPREKKSYDALIDPSLPVEEIRRLRRMLSNRESARRSRRRRQSQLSTLEEELEQLKTDKERLRCELHRTSSFAQQLSVENQQLLAELERLRCQLAHVSTSAPPQQAVPAPAAPGPAPAAAPATTQAPLLAAPSGSLAGCLPVVGADVGAPPTAGRLPPFIEQAQRLANKLNQARA